MYIRVIYVCVCFVCYILYILYIYAYMVQLLGDRIPAVGFAIEGVLEHWLCDYKVPGSPAQP